MVSTEDLSKVGILTGTTAAGKTSIAIEFARAHGSIEIINADSILIYRHLDIGSAKPSDSEKKDVPHHLIDILDPDQSYNAGDFHRACKKCINEIHSRNHRALIVGGTGFYLKGLLYGSWGDIPSDPKLREALEKENAELFQELLTKDEAWALKITQGDRYRLVRALEVITLTGKTPSELDAALPKDPDPQFEFFVVDRDNSELHERISLRTQQMLDSGLIDEVKRIEKEYPTSRAIHSVGYQQVLDYLAGRTPQGRKIEAGEAGLKSEIELATRQLVKRQRTWFKAQRGAQHFILEKDRLELDQKLKALYA